MTGFQMSSYNKVKYKVKNDVYIDDKILKT